MPLLLENNNPFFGVWKIEESSSTLFSMLKHPEIYEKELEHKRTESRRCEWLAARVLLEHLAGGFHEVKYDINGAPFIEDKNVYISISHTKGYAAVLIQDHPHAGIDIEQRSERVLKVQKRFINKKEEESIDSNNPIEQLLVYWCAKETLFKMIGEKEVDFLKHLHVHPFEYDIKGRLKTSETRTIFCRDYEMIYMIEKDFVLTASL